MGAPVRLACVGNLQPVQPVGVAGVKYRAGEQTHESYWSI